MMDSPCWLKASRSRDESWSVCGWTQCCRQFFPPDCRGLRQRLYHGHGLGSLSSLQIVKIGNSDRTVWKAKKPILLGQYWQITSWRNRLFQSKPLLVSYILYSILTKTHLWLFISFPLIDIFIDWELDCVCVTNSNSVSKLIKTRNSNWNIAGLVIQTNVVHLGT